ncbi:MAG: Maf-like protein, partial [Clostridiales bacterium]|nr:Maf-like protein [Clostridiales bacterium]
ISGEDKKTKVAFEMTRVQFISLDDAQIRAYIDSGEPFGKAGAYAIQGIAGMFICRIEGSYTSVVGLPMHLIKALLEEVKLKLL